MTGGGGGGGVGTGGGIVKNQNVAAGTPSMSSSTSSGYGSQAVSCSNLTNDDTYSIRSLSVGETPETMSPSNMRNDHNNAKSDCYTPAEISAGFNASAISSEFPKRVNPFLKDVASFDELNGNREDEDEDDEDEHVHQQFHCNRKRASEPAIMHSASTEMISEEDEGVDEQVVEDEEEEEEATRTIEEVGQEQQQRQDESNRNDTIDEENNSSKLMQDSDVMESSFSTPSKYENIPDWVLVGESVQIRPYNTSGVIAFIGGTHFQGGTWIGVELDTPTGKNDGTVQGIQYFSCKQKHGIFVRVDKLILDKRGRAMREMKRAEKMKAEFAGQKGKPVSANGPRK